jgi:polysaccharide export outer membrane protein
MGTRFFILISVTYLLLLASSCATPNKIAYFQNASDTTYRQLIGTVDAPLQRNDFISIAISSANGTAAEIFNPVVGRTDRTGIAPAKDAQYIGYLINNDGFIELPVLGKIMVAGLTKTQLKNNITQSILKDKLLVDPIVDIRLLNFEVTILGEVAHPTVITVPSEKISLVKALGMAGDITVYGKKDNVLLIREENGIRKTRRIDLNSSDFLNSEYYYLRPNDVVYVEPNKVKVAISGRSQQVLPLVLTGASILVLVLDRVIK